MIVNHEVIEDNAYFCGEHVKNYLVFKCNIPILSQDGKGGYYFSKNSRLYESLDKMPLILKLVAVFEKL